MIRGLQRALHSGAAEARICRHGTILTVLLFVPYAVVAHVLAWPAWLPFGLTDVAALAVIAVAVGVGTRLRLRRLERAVDETERQRLQAEARAAENEAAIRVVCVVAHEFAQPLSGALAYSELLMLRADDFVGFQRRELEGLREGVLQMERLLQTLRQTVQVPGESPLDRRIVDDVVRRVAAPRPRLAVRRTVASLCGDAPDLPRRP